MIEVSGIKLICHFSRLQNKFNELTYLFIDLEST